MKRHFSFGRGLHWNLFIILTLTPALIVLFTYVFFPTFYSFYLSLFRTRLYQPIEFIGLQHYQNVLNDAIFWRAFRNTFYFALGSVIGTLVFGLAIALLLDTKLRGKQFFRAALFMPYIVPYAAYALLWYWLFDPRYGLVNYLLGFIGINPVPWLQSSAWVIPAFILMSIWKRLGFAMVLFLAGLQTIPDDLYDAATVDGANWWAKFIHVTLPLLSPITLFVTVISIIFSMQLFIEPFVMTKGGPSYGSISVVYLIYQEGFRSLNIGRSSAMAVILFVVIFFLTILLLRRFRVEEIYA